MNSTILNLETLSQTVRIYNTRCNKRIIYCALVHSYIYVYVINVTNSASKTNLQPEKQRNNIRKFSRIVIQESLESQQSARKEQE